MDGLVPGIVQDARSGEVLMLGFLNADQLRQDAGDRVCHLLEPHAPEAVDEGRDQRQPAAVVSAATDCDNDTLLFRVEVEGDGLVCHEGTVSCFTQAHCALTERGGEPWLTS